MNRSSLLKSLAEEIERENLFARDECVVVGVSGGPDSMALLHALHELNGTHGFELSLHIAHLDHRLRGLEGEKDAAFVQGAADDLSLPCTMEQVDIGALANESEGSIEEVGRRERYAFLERVCAKVGAGAVATGHQRDDDAETIMHRILRGTGLRGLAGIPRNRALRVGSPIRLVRPMLRFERRHLIEYLSEAGVPFREDRSNEDQSMMRNRIRHTVLPMLAEQVNPQVREALLRLGEQARWLEEYFRETIYRTFDTLVIARTDQELALNAAALAKKSRIVQTELIRRAVTAFQLGEQELGFAQILGVLELIADPGSGKMLHLPGGMTVVKRYNRLVFSLPTDEPRESIASEIAVHVPGKTVLPVRRLEINCTIADVDYETRTKYIQRQHVTQAAAPNAPGNRRKAMTEWVAFDRLRLPLVVRTRAPGDRFWPLGAPGSKKLSEFLSDAKVDPDERDRAAILCDQLGPVWIIGYRIDERVRLSPQTQRVLQLEAISNDG